MDGKKLDVTTPSYTFSSDKYGIYELTYAVVDNKTGVKFSLSTYQSEWRPDKAVLHLFPHWNWTEGQDIDLWAYYNNADEVELFVNGKSQGCLLYTSKV